MNFMLGKSSVGVLRPAPLLGRKAKLLGHFLAYGKLLGRRGIRLRGWQGLLGLATELLGDGFAIPSPC